MTIKRDEKRCLLCGLCVSQCQFGVFKGEGEHMVGQSRIFESIALDNGLCTDCGECTAYQFWCPAEAVYDDSTDKTVYPDARVERGDDGKKYSKLIFEYNEAEDPFAQRIGEDVPFNQIMRYLHPTQRRPFSLEASLYYSSVDFHRGQPGAGPHREGISPVPEARTVGFSGPYEPCFR